MDIKQGSTVIETWVFELNTKAPMPDNKINAVLEDLGHKMAARRLSQNNLAFGVRLLQPGTTTATFTVGHQGAYEHFSLVH